MLWYNHIVSHSSAHKYLLNGAFSQVSDMAHGLVSNMAHGILVLMDLPFPLELFNPVLINVLFKFILKVAKSKFSCVHI